VRRAKQAAAALAMTAALAAAPGVACAAEEAEPPPAAAAPGEHPPIDESPWFVGGRAAVARARRLAPSPAPKPARNLVIFLGDGMGLTTVTSARILEGQQRGEPGEENALAFEALPHVALVKTYNTDQQTPDSAGTMTAILTGAKTRAGVISVDEHPERGDFEAVAAHRLPTLFEQAEERGLRTGIVSTAHVTHATPACAYAHSPDRRWEDDSKLPEPAREAGFPDIARQLVEWPYGDGLDVVLGGGRRHFLPTAARDPEHAEGRGTRGDGRNLAAEWAAEPPGVYVWNREGFDAVDPATGPRLLGLFQPSHMQFEVDRPNDPAGEPSLAEMTRKAIEILSRGPRGYVLLVEGGRIDHAHHLGNAHRALADTVAFSDAVRTALESTSREDTLVVVTADHGHTLTVGGYSQRGNPILGLVVKRDGNGQPDTDTKGRPYTTLGYQNGPGHRIERPDLGGVDTTAPDFLQEATVPLRSETHSAEDVPVYAGGPRAHLIHGVQEQSYLYHAMVEALGWNEPPEAQER
jgi:alkaline phosphatase